DGADARVPVDAARELTTTAARTAAADGPTCTAPDWPTACADGPTAGTDEPARAAGEPRAGVPASTPALADDRDRRGSGRDRRGRHHLRRHVPDRFTLDSATSAIRPYGRPGLAARRLVESYR